MREGGAYVGALLEKHGRLHGHINAGNLKMIRWLEKNGFATEDTGCGYVRFEKCAPR
jgi:RimJ/RimL family protein N-acetyltransferase